jgi:adenylate cyclase
MRVVIVFIDIRGSTALAERNLAYDVVFILNEFFAEMAAALRDTNGHYAQFNGDGLMALYGMEDDFEAGCRQALRGAAEMLRRLDRLNQRFAGELSEPLRIGIGIHGGDAIVGTMGPPASPILSAIGDAVNIAARLEAETKVVGRPLVISRVVAEAAGVDLAGALLAEADIDGREEPVMIVGIADPRAIVLAEPADV